MPLSGVGDQHLLRRCDAFTLGLERDAVERVEEIDGGVALLSPGLPLVWSANYLCFERSDLGAEGMAELSDRVLGGLGMEHRAVAVLDPAQSERAEPGFARIGWEVERDLFMVQRAQPDRPPAGEVAVRPQGLPEPLRHRLLLEDEFLATQPQPLEPVVEQLLEWERRQGRVGGDRWYVAEADGEPAAACRLLSRGGVGQVEDVATLRATRNRGLARASVLAAAEASQQAGNDLTFVIADAEDWPRKLYQRLGFEPIGVLLSFRLRPGRRPLPGLRG